MTDADARSERRPPGTRLIGNCGQYRRGTRGVLANVNSEPPPRTPRTMGPKQGRSRDLPYARVPDSLLLSHSSTATLTVPRIGSRARSVMLPDSLRQPPSPALRAEAPDERQRTCVQHAPCSFCGHDAMCVMLRAEYVLHLRCGHCRTMLTVLQPRQDVVG